MSYSGLRKKYDSEGPSAFVLFASRCLHTMMSYFHLEWGSLAAISCRPGLISLGSHPVLKRIYFRVFGENAKAIVPQAKSMSEVRAGSQGNGISKAQ